MRRISGGGPAAPHRHDWRWAVGGEVDEAGRTSRIEIELTPIGDGTELTFTHADLWSELSVRGHAQGWTGAFDKLVRHLEDAASTPGLTREQLQ